MFLYKDIVYKGKQRVKSVILSVKYHIMEIHKYSIHCKSMFHIPSLHKSLWLNHTANMFKQSLCELTVQ